MNKLLEEGVGTRWLCAVASFPMLALIYKHFIHPLAEASPAPTIHGLRRPIRRMVGATLAVALTPKSYPSVAFATAFERPMTIPTMPTMSRSTPAPKPP
jgi:hypothetical protein